MSDEGAFAGDLIEQETQCVLVAFHGEVRDPPHALAQNVNDRSDVVVLRAQRGGPQVENFQSGSFRRGAGILRTAPAVSSAMLAGPTCWEK